LVHDTRFLALATNDKVGEVPARPTLIEPELPPTIVCDSVNEAVPVEVVHVPLRAGAHEASSYNVQAVESALFVECLAVD
jgi:hypothetical protein